MDLIELRRSYHQEICTRIMYIDNKGIPNIADKHSGVSSAIARGLVEKINCQSTLPSTITGQTAGSRFEKANRRFLQQAFRMLHHLRPGKWLFDATGDISQFQQYRHLDEIAAILADNPGLRTALGKDYFITPDVVIAKYPVEDAEINRMENIIPAYEDIATLTPLRARNREQPVLMLHASISVKWTLRSDRAQNARTEALNLIRNRKGHTPHIVVVTAEPSPGRIASLALGTGDVDCIYHFALPELQEVVRQVASDDTVELLENMVSGERLRDIADLPLDLVM